MQFFHETKIDFVGKRQLFFIISAAILIIGLLSTIVLGVEYGIDFEGGTEIAVSFPNDKPIETEQIRDAVNKGGLTGTEIKSYGSGNQFLIRVKDSEKAPTIVSESLKNYPAFSGMNIETLKVDKIGPKIGSELRSQAFIAVFLSVLAILIYIAFRFEFTFGIGAIVALIHDVILTFTVLVIVNYFTPMRLEFDQSILAGMLTVIGFSINDTVIIFDRIRENREKYKGRNFIQMVNTSINETLSRTINTVLTAVLVLLSLVFFGGPVLQGFAFTMLVGIITGTYSSIYIASSFVIWFMEKVKKVDLDKGIDSKKSVGALKV